VLIGLYKETLSVLGQMPETAAYRTTTSSLVNQRLSIVNAVRVETFFF
jgi:hypothetical protein